MSSARRKEALLDITTIEDIIATKDMSKEIFFDLADIGKSTWHRIKKNGTASIPVSCAIAYALGVDPNDIIYKTRANQSASKAGRTQKS